MSLERTLLAAQGYLELGMPGDTLRELDSLPWEEQGNEDVLQLRLFVFMKGHQWDDALGVCDRLREEFPDCGTGFIHSAFCLHELGRTQEAKDMLLGGPAALLREATYHYNLGCYDAVLGNVEEATRHLEASFQIDKKFREIAKGDPDLKAVQKFLEE
jgi:tetratricopeptide (TPR) repeat protein